MLVLSMLKINNKQLKLKYQFADSPPYVLENIKRKGAEMKNELLSQNLRYTQTLFSGV